MNLAQNKIPLFFRPENAGFIVKGNFMTLAAKPHLVEEGEWLAHQSKGNVSNGFSVRTVANISYSC